MSAFARSLCAGTAPCLPAEVLVVQRKIGPTDRCGRVAEPKVNIDAIQAGLVR